MGTLSLARADSASMSLDVFAFLTKNRRLPRVGDVPAPWQYRGWMLPYVIQLHGLIPAVSDRWGYHLRTLDTGHLLDESIPQVVFGEPNNKVFDMLHEWPRLIGYDCGGWSDFRTWLDWLCWGLALNSEKPRLSEEVNEKLYRQVNLGPMLEKPHDYLGDHVASSKARGRNPTAFFPTPHSVAECIIRMTMHDTGTKGRDPRTLSVNDPCVGSGRLLLHASNISLNLYGQDIDPLAVAMCKINGALYAPWMSFPLPASILGTGAEPATASLSAPELPYEDMPIFRVHDPVKELLFEP